MPRDITITFSDGTNHQYNNTPDSVTPDDIEKRAKKDYPTKKISNISGGKKKPAGDPLSADPISANARPKDSAEPVKKKDELEQVKKDAGISSQGTDPRSNISNVQKQYDWQFGDTKGPDQIEKIVDRKAGGKVAVTAKKRYFLIYNWKDIDKATRNQLDPGPYGLIMMSVPSTILP